MKLNLGCGKQKLSGYVNIDKEPGVQPDLVHDLDTVPWPFDANTAEEILAVHVIEHLGQAPQVFLAIIKEIHRILKPGGIFEIRTPHHHSDNYWGDPTHVRPVTGAMMELFSKRNCKTWTEKGWPNTPLAEYLDVDFEIQHTDLQLTPHWAQRWHNKEITQEYLDHALATLWNVVDQITMTIVKIE